MDRKKLIKKTKLFNRISRIIAIVNIGAALAYFIIAWLYGSTFFLTLSVYYIVIGSSIGILMYLHTIIMRMKLSNYISELDSKN